MINTAISAVNSHVMLPVAKACLEYDPDFLVVYMGNNEVAGPFGAGEFVYGFWRQSQLSPFEQFSQVLKVIPDDGGAGREAPSDFGRLERDGFFIWRIQF